MWISVRTFTGDRTERFDGLSKQTKIKVIRGKISERWDVPAARTRLFYRGKQLVDKHTLFEYGVGVNDILQLMISPAVTEEKEEEVVGRTETTKPAENGETEEKSGSAERDVDGIYLISEEVDVCETETGAWFEGVVKRCFTSQASPNEPVYTVALDGYEEGDNLTVTKFDIRPRAQHIIPKCDLVTGITCMVNHNFDDPGERGFWYDAVVTMVTKSGDDVTADVTSGTGVISTKLSFLDDIYRIESRECRPEKKLKTSSVAKRQSAPQCAHCLDNTRKKCKECGCCVCGGKEHPNKQLLCDECNAAYHIYCLDPPLDSIPDCDEWYCPGCKNDETEIVRAGEGLKKRKKTKGTVSKKDWGKGMSCQGLNKICSIVPHTHSGPIPGIPVGSLWWYRLQVSEVGVHRLHVAGIHGRENDAAYSIVLSGGYEDDQDLGDEFYYTGSGGRDLSGNKRSAGQSSDQKLTKMNLALARSCATKLSKEGGEAEEWTEGRPIRVVRSSKLAKHSKYAPSEGYRYDGIYKLVKYWPEQGKSGFLVWRYFLRRDDPEPAPWTPEGKKRSKELGLKMIYPEGFLPGGENKENQGGGSKKRKRESGGLSGHIKPTNKKPATQTHEEVFISEKVRELIVADTANSKLWAEILSHPSSDFHSTTTETFTCIICTELVYQPVTTPCSHNLCQGCLRRSFKAEVYTCPCCRFDLGRDFRMDVNKGLQSVLVEVFPTYTVGR